MAFIVFGGGIALVASLCVCALVVCCCRRRRARQKAGRPKSAGDGANQRGSGAARGSLVAITMPDDIARGPGAPHAPPLPPLPTPSMLAMPADSNTRWHAQRTDKI